MNLVSDYLNNLLSFDDVVVLGCSGGPDSMCLLHLLLKLRDVKKFDIVVAHVNHNVRKASDDELLFLKNFCNRYNVMFEAMKIEKYGDDNFHNEARTIRYNFFDSIVTKYGAKYLMTAHHGDDLIETVLMRIVRGSTLSGYAGFSMEVLKDNYKIIRPLIYTTKDDILFYNKKYGVSYVIDKSNFKTKYTRNRYRKYVLPFLKKEDKNVNLKFLKYSKTLLEYNNYIDKEVSSIVNDVIIDGVIKVDKYLSLDDLIKNKILYIMLEKFYLDDLILINDTHVALINNIILSKKSNTYVYLPNNIKVVKSYNDIIFSKDTELDCNYEIEISDYVHLPNNKSITRIYEQDKNDNSYCRLKLSDVVLPLTVRTRRSGDKMKVKGMSGTKKVKDIFINSKIPVRERDIWPVVVDATGKIVWLPGIKKSQFDIPKSEKCDIILWYN